MHEKNTTWVLSLLSLLKYGIILHLEQSNHGKRSNLRKIHSLSASVNTKHYSSLCTQFCPFLTNHVDLTSCMRAQAHTTIFILQLIILSHGNM